MIAQFFIFLLFLDAAIVAIGVSRKFNMWTFVVAYWVLLTLKNLCDFMGW